MRTKAVTDLLEYADRKIRYSQETIEEFQTKLQKNPIHAFSWGADALEAAARVNAWMQVEKLTKDGVNVEKIAKVMHDAAFRMIRHGSDFKSTSPMSNAAKMAEASAYAEVAEDLADWRLS